MRITAEIHMLEQAAKFLAPLLGEIVFVGGATVALHLSDPTAPMPRPTDDIDVIAQVASRIEYYAMEAKIAELGFGQDSGNSVICRWFGHGLIVDLMSSDPDVIGFSNPWYRSAIKHALSFELPSTAKILVIDAPHLLATKLVAFADRGKSDIYGSHDLEDIILLVDGRPELVDELSQSPKELRSFV
jgi:hypothetical protein